MRFSLIRVPAIALLASFALLAHEAGAATILIFGQTNSTDVITESISGSTVTLTSGAGGTAVSIPASITNIGGVTPLGGSLSGFETFTLTSTTGPGGYSGTIVFSQLANGGGLPILTATVTGGLLTLNGGAAGFTANNTVFSNVNPAILAQVGLPTFAGSTSLSFVNLTPTSNGFTAQNSGLFSSAVPEPASIVSGCIAVLAGLGCLGVRRIRASAA
jgi:hypothetical protein